MSLVRFLRHAPPFMPGDVTTYDDDRARALEAKGVVEVLPAAGTAARPAEPAKGKP